jgi:hypothetical protein
MRAVYKLHVTVILWPRDFMWIISIDLEFISCLAYSNLKSETMMQNNRSLESDVAFLV